MEEVRVEVKVKCDEQSISLSACSVAYCSIKLVERVILICI